ncbi:serine/threonine-protein kinase EDR1 [Magnolia sinica]|uniref:serine/threonine-protein kinase EDR1 n=1 Tax=Magnolia sinica TaxID=86752 RepID=UPI00265ABC33|nr:serine/threonine-protein kinase EDR1 [Magnolia sinica]
MKHIFKKLHFGGSNSSSHDPTSQPQRSSSPSNEISSPPSCGSDHRMASASNSGYSPASPSSPSPAAATTAASVPSAPDRADYFSSEEEFQIQLALAISASSSSSNAGFRDEDPEKDQILAATLLSLGRHRVDLVCNGEEAAEALSRRYWDYNVLDYEEKVVDGFYDIYGLASDPASQGKMPSLADLQTNHGDLGFEVVMVNRAIDHALEELVQVAHCIALDCPVTEISLLVQRISELVTEHMGGPVKDANDMLARWTERSTELRTSLQTSVLPIGCLNIGLSRHRALLFKVLADNVGISCRLVKGSHYTGIDDDAVNIIKLENERESLVDLMAEPGTLIPAEILSSMDTSLNSYNPRLRKNLTPWASDLGVDLSRTEPIHGENKSSKESNGMPMRNSSSEKAILIPSLPSTSNGVSIGSSSSGNLRASVPASQSHQLLPSVGAASSQQKGNHGVPVVGDGVKEKLNVVPYSQDTVDSRTLFADLNPFQMIGAGKACTQNNVTENKVNEPQRQRENVASGPGRPPLPLMWKTRTACNEVPRTKQYEFVEGLFPRKNLEAKDFHSTPSSSEKIYPESPNISDAESTCMSHSAGTSNTDSETKGGTSSGHGLSSGGDWVLVGSMGHYNKLLSNDGGSRVDKPLVSIQSSEEVRREKAYRGGGVLQNTAVDDLKEHHKYLNNKRDRRKCIHDRFMETAMTSKDPENSSSPVHAGLNRLDPMLDDVAEWEIPWEDLVIGERIGLGSYGEVYHADWNGTEVAVKKFLDQDFSGDALVEFRSEVRIMRRLRHPNVVLFMGAVTRPPNLSIVTEFLPRGSLYRILHRPNCQIDEKRRIKMALDVAKGMNCLHTSIPTIVHRDLKSPNLLVDKNWNVKVCDFGLSRLKHNTFLSSKSTAGTPEWMAPEVLRNEPSDEKCDVYSFGVILWELATLRMPWSGMNPMQVVGAVGFQNRRLEIPKEVDPLVARIIWECWQTDPSLRPSFAQLTSALKPLQQLAISSHQDTQSSHLPQEISVNSTP